MVAALLTLDLFALTPSVDSFILDLDPQSQDGLMSDIDIIRENTHIGSVTQAHIQFILTDRTCTYTLGGAGLALGPMYIRTIVY